eukprot:GEMP01013689.1.p1 GENE.GEMP01013689.1~~GEMP01013689.1.p1  ORF type:complete len:673 (+),score=136.20 GEMP01013689.1:22-2019(+)
MTDLANLRTVLQDPDILTQLCRMSLQYSGTNAQSSLSATCHRFGQSVIESYNIVDADVVENMTKVYRHHFSTQYSKERQHQSFELRCIEYLKDCLLVVDDHLSQPRKTPSWQCRGIWKTSPLEVIPSAPTSPSSKRPSVRGDASSISPTERKSSPAQMVTVPGFPASGLRGSQVSPRDLSNSALWTPVTSPRRVPRISLSTPYLTDFKALRPPSPAVSTRALSGRASHPGTGQPVAQATTRPASTTKTPMREAPSPSAAQGSRSINSPFMFSPRLSSRITGPLIKPVVLPGVFQPSVPSLPRPSKTGTGAPTAVPSPTALAASTAVPKNYAMHRAESPSADRAQRAGDESMALGRHTAGAERFRAESSVDRAQRASDESMALGRHTAGAELFRSIARVSATTRMGHEHQLHRVEEAVAAAKIDHPLAPNQLLALTKGCGPKAEVRVSDVATPSAPSVPSAPAVVTVHSATSSTQGQAVERVSLTQGQETGYDWHISDAMRRSAPALGVLCGDNNKGIGTGRQQHPQSSQGQRNARDVAPSISSPSVATATVRTMQDIDSSKAKSPKSKSKVKIRAKVATFRKPQPNPQRTDSPDKGHVAAREQVDGHADSPSRQRNTNSPSPRGGHHKPVTSISSTRRAMHLRDKRTLEMKANRFSQGVLGARSP